MHMLSLRIVWPSQLDLQHQGDGAAVWSACAGERKAAMVRERRIASAWIPARISCSSCLHDMAGFRGCDLPAASGKCTLQEENPWGINVGAPPTQPLILGV